MNAQMVKKLNPRLLASQGGTLKGMETLHVHNVTVAQIEPALTQILLLTHAPFIQHLLRRYRTTD